MKTWAQWTVGIALVAAAWGVALITPSEASRDAPFEITVEVGERGLGRNIDATVTDVRLVTSLSAKGWAMDGNWLVADIDVASVLSEAGVSLGGATFVIDGRSFRASERMPSLLRSPLSTGIPLRGSLAFELPSDLTSGSGQLRLAISDQERLDSVVVLEVSLDELEQLPAYEMLADSWSTP